MRSLPLVLLATALGAGCGRSSRGTRVPATPPPVVLEKGVRFQEVAVTKFSERPRLWIYTPDDKRKNRPCVVIAAAGSNLASGMRLSEGDRAEHLPYVKAGFVVVAYDVSGELGETATPAQQKAALDVFAKRDVGIANGKAAIDYALRNLPIEPMRLYAIGHSSAGTLALQLAAADSRIRGCVAFAPVTDVAARLSGRLNPLGPDVAKAIRTHSPSSNIENLRCPVMLFGAQDDDNVPFASVQAYSAALSKKNHDVTLVQAVTGGHYDSMISKGIPAAIEWMGRARRRERNATN